ncbi:MAG: hypothetical protein D5S00_07485 [Tindallia sp. MSAO_Bac2]|nr:MAG: hypothetical protein D5S00_07485 [Tindallia sp. MSAO_Bac2]
MEEKVNVYIIDTTGNKEQQASLPTDIPVNRILVKLAEKMELPTTGPDGNPISYKFIHKASGKQLTDEQTLAEAEVQEDDVLRLQPEITAGV